MDFENFFTKDRKLDHIKAVLERNVESLFPTLLDDVRLIHNSLPEHDLDDVDLSVDFCGRRLNAPLVITGMTGGHPDVAKINKDLATIAEKYGLAMGVGSQRAAIENRSLAYTFSIARQAAPNTFLIANIGAPQLSKGYGIQEVLRAIEMIDADAIAIHLNPAQEAFQLEGEPYFSNIIEKIIKIIDEINIPVIIKETGNGLSKEIIKILYNIGIKCFDVAGLGGTNWVKVEVIRAEMRGNTPLPAGPLADYWGNPTAVSIVEARDAAPASYIIGSGGVRTGLDAAKVIALGADVAGIALPILRALIRGGLRGAEKYVSSILYQLKTVIFLTGGIRTSHLWRAPVAITGRLLEELSQRGINTQDYLYRRRLYPLRVRK